MKGRRFATRPPSRVILSTFTLSGAAIGGALIVQFPQTFTIILASAGALVLISLRDELEHIWLGALFGVLCGYAVQGKGFAYIGVAPLYVGELTLALGIVAVFLGRIKRKLGQLQILLFAFMILGLIRTVPYIGEFGISAIRDAALWYYALFAIVLYLLLTQANMESAIYLYGKFLPFLVVWVVLMSVFFRFLPTSLPHFPGSPFPILSVMKAGDRAVILAGLAAFMLTGLYDGLNLSRRMSASVFWLCWLTSAIVVAIGNRGGMLSMGATVAILTFVRPSRRLFQMDAVSSLAALLLITVNPTIHTGKSRDVSVSQLVANFTSVFSNGTKNAGGVQATKEWRLNWWEKIYGYTFDGPYFWTGKGFGINLADSDGFQVSADHSLRSPHNSHMTVLARMGVPGLLLWIAFQLSFAGSLIRAYIRAHRQGAEEWAGIDLWVLAMWLAVMVNTSFDVYLEGPQGAIPFWCVVGFGLAVLRIQNAQADQRRLATTYQGAVVAHSPST